MSLPHWVCPRSWLVCFPSLHCAGSRLLCQELSEAGPGLSALSRSKLLRFRFSATPQRRRLDWAWACILFPSPVRAAQVTRCLASCDLSPPLSQPLGFLGVQQAPPLRCAVCLLWGADLWLRPSRRMLTVQNPKESWLAKKPVCSLVDDASLGLRLSPSGSGCPACLSLAGDGPVHSRLALLSPLFPGGLEGKASVCNAGNLGSIPGSGRSPEKEIATHSSTLAWNNPMDGGAW